MIRISVVSTRDVVKKSIKIIAIVLLFIIIVYTIKLSNKYLNRIELSSREALLFIGEEISMMGNIEEFDLSKVYPEQILSKELGFSEIPKKEEEYVEVDDSTDIAEENTEVVPVSNNQEQDSNQDINISDIAENQSTEIIPSSYKQTYNYEVEGVKIKNESKYDLNTLNLSSSNSKVTSKDIILFHTHTCESYTKTDNNQYESSGNYRTTDLSHSVAHVGDVLESYLKNMGFNVLHDKTYHDYPAYNGSYGRSLKTVSALKQKNKNVEIIIDLHRDAMSDETYAPKVKIGDEYAAQIMFVIGTDGNGLEHNNWRKNLEFAIKVQKIGNDMYPGLFKPIIVRNARYNQHLSGAATIIEFGATGNTLEECEVSAKYLSKVLEKVTQ